MKFHSLIFYQSGRRCCSPFDDAKLNKRPNAATASSSFSLGYYTLMRGEVDTCKELKFPSDRSSHDLGSKHKQKYSSAIPQYSVVHFKREENS